MSRSSVVVALALLVSACSGSEGRSQSSNTTNRMTDPTATSAPLPQFVRTNPGVTNKCARDASILGWAVPCPAALPGVSDPDWCTTGPVAAPTPTCVYTGGEPPIPMFYLSIDFPGPSPAGPDTVRHLVIEAFPRGAEKVLDPPCVSAEPLPALATTVGDLPMFRCGEKTLANESSIWHGEAINTNHDLIRWYRNGIAYAVTLHRSGLDTSAILRRVAEGLNYVS